jgi:hypothetical protein
MTMKKTYVKIDWEITSLMAEDVITTSGDQGYDPAGILKNPESHDRWEW